MRTGGWEETQRAIGGLPSEIYATFTSPSNPENRRARIEIARADRVGDRALFSDPPALD
jgi:hypothetical protein